MDLIGKAVGVWGYGIGGKALVNFLLEKKVSVLIFDQRTLDAKEKSFLDQHHVEVIESLPIFLERADYIFPSAGIDVRPFAQYAHKFLAELDLFQKFFKKPIIAVTGTLGKTTVTTYLGELLQRAGKKVVFGGNIGVGLCSLIAQQSEIDYGVIEVSSFQLELCKSFNPAISIWTNFYANHLDRHNSLQDYFAAKAHIIRYQKNDDVSIVPTHLRAQIEERSLYKHRWISIPARMPLDWKPFIPDYGVRENWKIICTVLSCLNISLKILKAPLNSLLEHRLEYVATIGRRSFYNDSKSTVSEATLSAVKQLNKEPIILLLGGLSKGVSREWLIRELKDRVKCVICFGRERDQLSQWCFNYNVPYSCVEEFDQVVKMAYNVSCPGDIILFSPSGSSFDLFKNYQERGKKFKDLVFQMKGRS